MSDLANGAISVISAALIRPSEFELSVEAIP
jgi:hypothetical protein